MNQLFLTKKKPDQKSLDFEFLRSQGIQHIIDLSGKIWTNHNLSDPGITTLELLCYAITDLGQRTNSSLPDILHENRDNPSLYEESGLWQPSQILPCHPVTINDIRKLLIDHARIKNAWVEIADQSELSLSINPASNEITYSAGTPMALNGLYNILVEFEEDEDLDDLNSSILKRSIDVEGSEVITEIAFPVWDEMPEDWRKLIAINEIKLLEVPGQPGEKLRLIPNSKDYFTVVEVSYAGSKKYKFGLRIKTTGPADLYTPEALKEAIIDELEVDAADITTDPAVLDDSLIVKFNQKIEAAHSIIKEVRLMLNNHRSLSEDFVSFKAVRIQEIAISADIEIFAESNKNAAVTEVLLAIDAFISPKINRYSLSEMLDKGWTLDRIYEGPLLENGFIDDQDLDQQETDTFFTSDVLKIILDQNGYLQEKYSNGIVSVSNLLLSNYINNQPLSVNNRNCLKLTQNKLYKPRFSVEKSRIRIMKGQKEVSDDFSEIIAIFYDLKDQNNEAIQLAETYLPETERQYLNLAQYQSIQNDFPINYGIGKAGIPGSGSHPSTTQSKTRSAQAKQLKAYLIVFEQLLANYLAQLSNIGALFSICPEQKMTYFNQPLYPIPDIKDLLGAYNPSTENWQSFVNNPENSYRSFLNDFPNEESGFQDRRERLLEHLIARFSESFVEYSLLYKAKNSDLSQLIDTKAHFLKDYPIISRDRARAYNYLKTKDTLPDVWDTDNVSGLEKRLCRKLGIKSHYRRNLVNALVRFFEIYDEVDTDGIPQKRFRVRNNSGDILLSSSKGYTDVNFMWEEIHEIIQYATDTSNYQTIYSSDEKYYFHLSNILGDIIARRIEPFDSIEEARTEIEEVTRFMVYNYEGEGMYLIEHLLLRPRLRDVPVMGSSDFISHNFLLMNTVDPDLSTDPYSFTVSVILPSGQSEADPALPDNPVRFTDPDFRTYAEKTIRKEIPAHILIDIYWLNQERLYEFQEYYRQWLLTINNTAASEQELIEAQNGLINTMNDLKNI